MCLPFSRLNGNWMVTEMRLKSFFPLTIQWRFRLHSVTIQSTERWDFILWLFGISLGSPSPIIWRRHRIGAKVRFYTVLTGLEQQVLFVLHMLVDSCKGPFYCGHIWQVLVLFLGKCSSYLNCIKFLGSLVRIYI